MDCFYLAWRYLRYHKLKTTVLVSSITLMVYLPAGLDALVNESAQQLRRRAASTPLLIGTQGSDVDLVLNSLYFESDPPVFSNLAQASRVWDSGFAQAIPLYVRFRAMGRPIVGTQIDYFDFRQLRMQRGRAFAVLGECVLGSEVARESRLAPGDALLSSPENAFDLAGVYPLKMKVAGILAPAGTPDDGAVFVDLKTAWVIEGLGHGHQDLARPQADDVVLKRQGNQVTANAAVVNFTEITEANIDSFHFHGEPDQFPLTGVIAVPNSDKASTLLMGRYQADGDPAQIVRPSVVMDELLAAVLRVRRFILAGAFLLGVATFSSIVLVFVLSLRLRQRELATMAKIGGSRWRIIAIVACEILVVIALSFGIAGGMSMATRRFGEQAIRWFLL